MHEISEGTANKENQATNGNAEILHLNLEIRDLIIAKYLTPLGEANRQEKAIEALRIGIIAIQSASPSLDSKIVEEKFGEVKARIDECLDNFQNETKSRLEEYFQDGNGAFPKSLDKLFGERGNLTQLFNQYFGTEGGKVLGLLQNQIGPTSPFSKSLDPNNKEGVILRIEHVVNTKLQEKTDEIVKQFSLDKEDSALSRLSTTINQKISEIQNNNAKFFAELKGAMGVKAGITLEAERGTEKGRVFETSLYEEVAEMGRILGDSTENVRSIVGSIPRSKTGDYVITLGETTGAPGGKVVIEAKKEQNYRLKDAVDELKIAKENRSSTVGIFVFAKGYEPAEVGDFYRLGHDFYVTVDETALENGEPLLFLETAYKIARVLLVTSVRKQEAKEIDTVSIRAEIESAIQIVTRLSDLKTKAKTISNNSKIIEDTLSELQGEMENRLNQILRLLG